MLYHERPEAQFIKVKLRWHFQPVIKPSLNIVFGRADGNIGGKVTDIQNQIVQSFRLKENQMTVA